MGSFNDPFPFRDQFLVEFFAASEASELKLDIHVRLESRPPDKVPRHVDDLNRGPQVGDEEPAPPSTATELLGSQIRMDVTDKFSQQVDSLDFCSLTV